MEMEASYFVLVRTQLRSSSGSNLSVGGWVSTHCKKNLVFQAYVLLRRLFGVENHKSFGGFGFEGLSRYCRRYPLFQELLKWEMCPNMPPKGPVQ
ncbi:hypothetical protein D9M68_607930 [compost metagenome]